MDRPFREVHELYKILYQRAEAQQAAEEARKKKEAEEEAARKNQSNKSSGGFPKPPQYSRKLLSDATTAQSNTSNIEPSPLEMEALEEAFEDMII